MTSPLPACLYPDALKLVAYGTSASFFPLLLCAESWLFGDVMDRETLVSPDLSSVDPIVPMNACKRRPTTFFTRHPQFALLWASQTLSRFGSYISGTGLPLVAITLLHAHAFQLSLLVACSSLPVLLLSLFAGVWLDRLPLRPMLIAADLGRACLLASIPLVYLLGGLHFELLYVVTLLISTLTIFFEVGQRSLLPLLLRGDDLIVGNSRLGISDALGEIAGPPFASWLILLIQAPLAILFDACSFVISALCLCYLHIPKQDRAVSEPKIAETGVGQGDPFWQDLRAGLQFLVRHRSMRAIAAYTAIFNFSGGAFATLYLLYLLETLHLPLLSYGLIVMMGGIGNLLGAILARRVVRRVGAGKTLIFSAILFGFIGLGTPLAHGLPWQIVCLLMLVQLIGDCALTIYRINEITWRQTTIPEHIQGRINACMHLCEQGIGPIGAIAAALLCQIFHNDIRLTLSIGVCGMLLASTCLIFSPLAERSRMG